MSAKLREGQAPPKLDRERFGQRFRERFSDPAYQAAEGALAAIEEIAWTAYHEGRKAPRTRRAGDEFADPSYELSLDWLEARAKLRAAADRFGDPASPSRVLVIVGSPRNDGTCPNERSKTSRLAAIVAETLAKEEVEVDTLDLSLVTSEYGRQIYPCKGCVSTAMPLCHWPCSCYPNHALAQSGDIMNDVYERWVLAHGVVIVTPVHWYQAPTPLKAMIDRLVCADGGNTDPTRTGGKDAKKAKQVELDGWDYPQHLKDRAFGLVVHGDVAGVERVRAALADWLGWMGLVDAGFGSQLDRYIGYFAPYATSHDDLDRDTAVQEETRNVARAVAARVRQLRGGYLPPDRGGTRPRPK